MNETVVIFEMDPKSMSQESTDDHSPHRQGCVEVEGYPQLNILAHGQIAELNLMSQCGGHCECGTCRVLVLSGKLSQMKPEERALLLSKNMPVDGSVRLACQCFPELGETVKLKPLLGAARNSP